MFHQEPLIHIGILVPTTRDHFQIRHLLFQLQQTRQLFNTRRTPGCPQIHQNNLSAQFAQVHRTRPIAQHKLRRWLANVSRMASAVASRQYQRPQHQTHTNSDAHLSSSYNTNSVDPNAQNPPLISDASLQLSVIIPARNEARSLPACLATRSLPSPNLALRSASSGRSSSSTTTPPTPPSPSPTRPQPPLRVAFSGTPPLDLSDRGGFTGKNAACWLGPQQVTATGSSSPMQTSSPPESGDLPLHPRSRPPPRHPPLLLATTASQRLLAESSDAAGLFGARQRLPDEADQRPRQPSRRRQRPVHPR